MSQANKVFVGNLSDKVKESDIRDKFEKFGKILEISIKTPSHVRDAEDAVRELNGTELDGNTLRVEITKRGPRGEDPRDMERDERSRRQHGTSYRISVSGLSSDTSWQDLKDFLRDAGDVAHAEVDRRGHGTASFQTADQMDRAIRKLDDEELKGRRVRIRESRPLPLSLSFALATASPPSALSLPIPYPTSTQPSVGLA
ncbi:hypothetical protein DYB30_005167 [Aphanomyces astaci]|uniref:RRM domain-containing protein n=1 Tax=Aphanomyces astaci TaxID=112090 RepID=A0A396ZPR5_APHAT|nr:hypothetical protein DYB36_002670 [Aphanomyces astaci]RHY57287.1 hypothetical protein DYB30_005167 [Aphanomyces astaci]RHY67514.1 hypothetical protein DYB38_006414 [Aphanomyces astaci]RHY80742.1 hypothetical protein DYB26_010670 [Aphanomyces astaci]RHZ08098.1 hypothetical protein DYB31_006394 [Aphanomyces astaci]